MHAQKIRVDMRVQLPSQIGVRRSTLGSNIIYFSGCAIATCFKRTSMGRCLKDTPRCKDSDGRPERPLRLVESPPCEEVITTLLHVFPFLSLVSLPLAFLRFQSRLFAPTVAQRILETSKNRSFGVPSWLRYSICSKKLQIFYVDDSSKH